MSQHIFVVRGDLTLLHCDARLIPTDSRFHVTKSFATAVGLSEAAVLPLAPWTPNERVRRTSSPDGVPTWLARMAVEHDVGDEETIARWFTDGIEAFITAAVADISGADLGRPPLLGINLVGTGDGGARHRKGLVLKAMFNTLQQACTTVGADIAVVCWDATAYAGAQRARQQSLTDPTRATDAAAGLRSSWNFGDRTNELHRRARLLADAIQTRQLSLFLGAGVSAGAGLPEWHALLQAVNHQLGNRIIDHEAATRLDPRDFAAILERRFDTEAQPASFATTIAENLQSEHHSLQHSLLASIPVTEIITTNVDNLFEKAARSTGDLLSVMPARPRLEAERWLLKLHGSVDDPASLVFTRAAYLDAPRERGALFGLVQAMLLTRHMLFVGYSLSDEDFHEIVHEVRRAVPSTLRSGSLGTALTLFDDDLKAELWRDDVDVVAMRPKPAGTPTGADVAAAARDVERFLDLVGCLTTDMAQFVLDDTYSDMLNDDERDLRHALAPVMNVVVAGDDRPGWRDVDQLLRHLGRPTPDATHRAASDDR